MGFPNVPHKDLVDSTAQALAFLARYRRPPHPDPSGLFGPTGRRTRASLTRRAPEPVRAESEPEDDEMEEIASFVGADEAAQIYGGMARVYERLARDARAFKTEAAALESFLGTGAPA